MLENNDREEHNGVLKGSRVWFRFMGRTYRGQVKRLTSSKALIVFRPGKGQDLSWRYIAYNQIEGSTKDDTREESPMVKEVPEKQPETPPGLIPVWVVRTYRMMSPAVTKYLAAKVHKEKSFTLPDGKEIEVFPSFDERLFLSYEDVLHYCRAWMTQRVKISKATILLLEKKLQDDGLGLKVEHYDVPREKKKR